MTSRPVSPGDSVALTGATGFIGSRLTARLLADGYQVRALVRDRKRAAPLARLGATLLQGELTDPVAAESLVSNSAALIYCAGSVRGSRLDDFLPANLHGLQTIVQAVARTAGHPPPLLLMSSLAAREPGLSNYARSKYLAEASLQGSGERVDWTVLRPPPVYGPGDRELLPLFQCMARGVAPLPGNPDNRFSIIHVDDVVAAVMAWLHHPGPRTALRGVYSVSDGRQQGYNWHDAADIVAAITGRRVRLLRLPKVPLDMLARLNQAASPWFGRAPMLTPGKLRELRHPDWVCDSSALSSALDWSPRLSLSEGLAPLLERPGRGGPGRTETDDHHRG